MDRSRFAFFAIFLITVGYLLGSYSVKLDRMTPQGSPQVSEPFSDSALQLQKDRCPLKDELKRVLARVHAPADSLSAKITKQCLLVAYLNEIYPHIKDESLSDQTLIYQNLLRRRQEVISQVSRIKLSSSPILFTIGHEDAPESHLDIFLKPTCGKCAKFYLSFLAKLSELEESLQRDNLKLMISVRPYQSAAGWYQDALPNSPQAQVDQELSALWYMVNQSQKPPTKDQLKRWYEVVKDHSLDLRYLKDPVGLFKEIMEIKLSLTPDQIKAQMLPILDDVKRLPKEAHTAPTAVLNGLSWHHLKDFHLNPMNIKTVIHADNQQELIRDK